MKKAGYRILSILALTGLTSMAAQAEWALDNAESNLSYVTSKAAAISEVNTFTELRGGITDDGQATLVINLASVDTAIDIRNERMRDIVFNVEQNPSAVVSVDISELDLTGKPAGTTSRLTVDARLSLHGTTETVSADVRVTNLVDGGIAVENTSPILVSAATFGLADAVEELREVAGLPSINPTITVDFSLVYRVY